MFLCKNLLARTNVWRRLLVNSAASNIVSSHAEYSGVALCNHNKYLFNDKCSRNRWNVTNLLPIHRKWCSKGLLDGDVGNLTVQHERVQKNITDIFPQPRVTLNELITKTPDKIFEIHYKQLTVAPKGRKKSTPNNDWTCTYAFVWPEKAKFESTAISKRKAAEKAATQAIHWLFMKNRIDTKGNPLYEQKVLQDIKKTLNESIHASISEKSMERVERIWNDYENGIKDIYEATFKEARNKILQTPAVLTKDSTIDDDDFSEEDEELSSFGESSEIKYHVHPVYGRKVSPPTANVLQRRNRALKQKFQLYDEELTPLPIDEYRDQITSTVQQNRVTVIVGAAGCGKSTRTPAAILRECGADTAAIVSEPRRVAAMGLADRVATELGEEVGESIGYQVRLHSKLPKPPGGSILYCTSGVLLRRLQTNPGLEGCTHVIIDEAHERDVNTDVTLLLLKRALDINPELKVVVMSATLDTGVFTSYFDQCPVIEVPGRTFPVEISYLDVIQKKFKLKMSYTAEVCNKIEGRPQVKCQEVADLVKAIDKTEGEGAILVFLPGWSDIKLTKQLLDEHYGQSAMHMILPVHSRLSTSDQAKMFSTPARGIRKIVLATNVAETSITIPDVVYVIDSGAHKENRIKDGTGTASLETVWVSQASAKQRTGRAGRVQPGHCYRMYTREKEVEFVPHTTPEILRIPLVQTVLECKSYAPNEKIASFLSQLPEPPSEKSINFAINDLIELGALTPQEQLTRLGTLLSSLSLHPRVSCSVLRSAVVGNVLAVTNMAAHCTSNTELFVNAAERRDEIREIKRKYSATSDYGALYWIQDEFDRLAQEGGRTASDKYCEKYGLRGDRLGLIQSLSTLHLEQLLSSTMISRTTEAEELNRFSDIEELVCGVLVSGADALLVTRRQVKTKGKLKTVVDVVTSTGDRAHIGTESVNKDITKRHTKPSLLCYFGGHQSTERRALVVYKTCVVPPQTPLLFSIGDLNKNLTFRTNYKSLIIRYGQKFEVKIETRESYTLRVRQTLATSNSTTTPSIEEEDGENTIFTLPKHRLQIIVPTSQADSILKAREMLWKTFEYYIERDVTKLDFDLNEKVSRFKVRLIKAIGRILVEGHREYVEGKSRIEDIEDMR